MKKNQTRRALLLSVLSLLLCVSMLVGTTFAWFTDTVTSGSNIIASGNLDIVLEYWDGDSWEDAEGKVIPFVAADGRAQDQILWEPGCTYEMASFRVRNAGSLNTKFIILINGVTGDEKLMEVVEFKTRVSNTPASLLNGSAGNVFQRLDGAELPILYGTPDGNVVFDHSLAGKGQVTPGTGHTDTSPEFTIFGHMAEEAGNEYQNLTIEGISLTVIATQQTYESDSFNNRYDANAEYPWNGVSTKAPVQDADGYYMIGSPAELAWLAAGDHKLTNVKLTADIDMQGVTIDPLGLNSYHVFDGNGKTISNVIVNGTGLFENIPTPGDIKNLILDNVTVNSASGAYAGIVCGKYSGTFTNITVKNSSVNAPNGEYVGGLAGAYYKSVSGCTVENCSILGTEKVGGLVGFFSLADVGYSIRFKDCSVSNVTVTATNTAKAYNGAILGRGLATGGNKFIFENCSAALQNGQKLIGQDYYNNIDVTAITVTTIN